MDEVARDERRSRCEFAEYLHVGAREADLLLGLAQRGLAQIGVLGILAPAGKRDLAGVAAQVGASLREHRVRLLVGAQEQWDENRCGDLIGSRGQGSSSRGAGSGVQRGNPLDAFLEHDLAVKRAVHRTLRGDHAQTLDLVLGQVLR